MFNVKNADYIKDDFALVQDDRGRYSLYEYVQDNTVSDDWEYVCGNMDMATSIRLIKALNL